MKFVLSAFADESSQNFDEQLQNLAENRISRIELRGVNGKNCADLDRAETGAALEKMKKAGITLSSLGSPYGKYPIDADFNPHMEQFRRGLDICRELGGDKIRVFSFYMPNGEKNPEKWKGKVTDQMWMMVEAADSAGIMLCHENEKGIYGDTDIRVQELIDAFGSRMGWIFDPANYIQCGVNCRKAFPGQLEKITYMHIKDALTADGAVVPAGCGDGNIAYLLQEICEKRSGEMVLTIEPHLTVFDGLQNLQGEKVVNHYSYPSSKDAFRAACGSLKGILTGLGMKETSAGIWEG